MAIINLRDYYPFYTSDCFMEVSEEVAEKHPRKNKKLPVKKLLRKKVPCMRIVKMWKKLQRPKVHSLQVILQFR